MNAHHYQHSPAYDSALIFLGVVGTRRAVGRGTKRTFLVFAGVGVGWG